MISIATMGKFTGIPTKAASAKYGGGTSAAIQYVDKHKFPMVNISKIDSDKNNININIIDMEEKE